MIYILINWVYMGILVFGAGMTLLQGYVYLMKKVNKEEHAECIRISQTFVTGIVGTTLYAQIFSVFHGVGIEANLLLIAIVLGYVLWQRKYLRSCILAWKRQFSSLGKGRWILYGIMLTVIVAYAFVTAGEAKQYDTDWYHAQTIRWIEECGCVKGVANLFYALGFNNAQHYFDALFSMKSFLGQSLRGTGGFFGIIICFHGLFRVWNAKSHTRHIADLLAVWEIAYSIIVTAFFTEAYVDTLPNMLVLFILTEWFALLEEKKENTIWFGYYCLVVVFATVCKTSVALSVLLTVYPVVLFIKQKKKIQIPLYLLMGFCIALPYVITNVITTGYPVYLLTAVDLFEVPWKIDPEVLRYCVDNMVAFARKPAAPMEEVLNCGLKWVPVWWERESISHQILYIAVAFMVLFDFVYTIGCMVRKKETDFWMFWPRLCVYGGLVYWFFTIPQVRYCWAFLIAPIAVLPMYYKEKKGCKWIGNGLLMVSMALLLLYSGFYSLRTLGYVKDGVLHYPVKQADYRKYVLSEVEKDGQVFYVRDENSDEFCGYYAFPYLDNKEDLGQLITGDSLKEGFYFERTND